MNKKIKNYVFFSGHVLVAVLLLILPADYFDTGKSVCLSQLIADTECPGCGMTRAIQHFIHFDFSGAWFYNKLSFIVFPILAFLFSRSAYRFYKKAKTGT